MSKKNLIVGQSGGPTAVINSSLYGVVSEGLRHPEQIQHIYGMVNGIEGFLAGTVLDFATALPGSSLEKLKTTPGAYLGSCRYKLPESLEDPIYPRLFQKFRVYFSEFLQKSGVNRIFLRFRKLIAAGAEVATWSRCKCFKAASGTCCVTI